MRRSLLASAAVVLVQAGPAWAHAHLLSSVPETGSVLPAPPKVVRFTFDAPVQAGSEISAVRNDGPSVLGGKPTVEGGHVLVVPLEPGLGPGDYSVRWSVVSDDGHPLSGVIAFGTGAGVPPPRAALTAGSNAPPPSDLIARWLLFLGLLATGGAAVFREVVWRPGLSAADLSEDARTEVAAREQVRTSLLLGVAFYVLVLGASIALLHIPQTSDTRFGQVMEVAIACAAAGVVAAIAAAASARSAAGSTVSRVFLLAPLLAVLPPLGGHAVERGRFEALRVVSDVIHVASAAVWFGGLLELAIVVPIAGAVVVPAARARLYGQLAGRFSTLAFASVAVLALSGLVRAATTFTAADQVWDSAYGLMIVIKTALLVALVALGAMNRSQLVPTLVGARGEPPALLARFARLRKNLVSEVAVLVALAAAVSLLTDLPPPS